MGELASKYADQSNGLVNSWGNWALKKSSCRPSRFHFNLTKLWAFPSVHKSSAAYVKAIKCGTARLRDLYASRGIEPIPADAVFIHFRCSDAPFVYNRGFPMVRAAYIDFALGEASRRHPDVDTLIIESCSHHASTSSQVELSNSAANKQGCSRFSRALAGYINRRWPRFLVRVMCFPEGESVRRMLGSRMLITTMPSTFSFVSGVQKGSDFITPKGFGEAPRYDDTDLHTKVPWTMFPGQAGTDVVRPVESVPNYHQLDYARLLDRNEIASLGERAWVPVAPDRERAKLWVVSLVLLCLIVPVSVAFYAVGGRRGYFRRR